MKKHFFRAGTLMVTGAMAFSSVMPNVTALASGTSAAPAKSTAEANDLAEADIIDFTKKGNLTIHKYDITAAEAAEVYKEGDRIANGEKDTALEEKLKDFSIAGVEFMRVHFDVEQYSVVNENGGHTELVYEVPTDFAQIIGLKGEDAFNMSADAVSQKCTKTGVLHYTSKQLQDAMNAVLVENTNVTTKNALESYVLKNGTAMPLTNANGVTTTENLDLGMYLIVETKVPEQVTNTVNPFFVALPFTNMTGEGENAAPGGQKWLYDADIYPKNQTGNPDIDKLVSNATGTLSTSEAAGAPDAKRFEGKDFLIYNTDATVEGSESDAAYVAARKEYTYSSTTTASAGDVLNYIIVSKLPHITSEATYLTDYSFKDTICKGITYNNDVRIALYDNKDDAKVNNTANAKVIWDKTSAFYTSTIAAAEDGKATDTVVFTETGLKEINTKYSDYYMVVYYSVTVDNNADLVLGDAGNDNDVTLTWERTSEDYYNTIEDKSIVYSYGLNLKKVFSDNDGDYSKVKFVLYNKQDGYYVVADYNQSDNVWYVDNSKKTTAKTAADAAASQATVFSPDVNGGFQINGLEADKYVLTEIATDNGYSLLGYEIEIDIASAEREIIPSVAGTVGLTAENLENIAANYNGGITDATGALVSDSKGTAADEDANGRTIGKTAMYIGELAIGSAQYGDASDGATMVKTDMVAHGESTNAIVQMEVMNNKNVDMPQTGGRGNLLFTITGVLVVGAGIGAIALSRKNRKTE